MLQDRVRGINRTIQQNEDQANLSRSKLVAIITKVDLDRCTDFIEKVRVERFKQVRDRQVRKLHILSNKHLTQVNNNRDNNKRDTLGVNANNTDSYQHRVRHGNNQIGYHNHDNNNSNSKWVINLSKVELTWAQRSLLKKGPNFAISPNNIPNLDYITAIETVCSKLKEEDAAELREEINGILKKGRIPKPNLDKEERLALHQLRKDKDRIILTADKGITMVVLDKEDYINKAKDLLNTPAYKEIPRDPTNKIKAQLITKLRRIKKERKLDEGTYRTMYPTGCIPPKFYGLPKIYKTGTTLRPIVSSRGSVTYGVAKVISKVIQPLVGRSPLIQSTSDFVSKAKGFTLQLGECLSSYDVTSLFTSVSIDPVLNVIKDLLEKDEKLNNRTVLSVQHIIELLGFCLHNTYISFQNKFYEQVEGAPMGLPISPIVANLYMESFEGKAIVSATNPPDMVYFVGDTWVIQKQPHKQGFLDHINSIDPANKFTVEGNQANGAIPFLDTLVTPLADNSLSFQMYQKATHTDQYLQWKSHHSLSSKYSVIGTLTHRAKVVCTTPELLKDELKHLKEALGKCKYPNWAISRVQNKVINSNQGDTGASNNNNSSTNEEDNGSTNNNNPTNTNTSSRTTKNP